MILIDTSVWIDHFRRPISAVIELVERNEAATHPFVIGELAMSSLPNRRDTLRDLNRLPGVVAATHAEVMALIEWQQLFSLGMGLADVHLLASARVAPHVRLWTRDKRLRAQADRLMVAHHE
ncbi:type II toxin-antitoxin system VapC family toxin [Sphingomonas sp.]|jgi:hypothetical protein|uniref:type II toxin-antitoxin system VapC family toxin n=1 Tax=Sphingomonas sp. TaxID=28214 RepID=UPI002D7FBAFE|nr:type II toxin-antitoxin system VapC family toxin [Sphingomonas sp.]HEU0044376.1 type II toxin-antitoxin system VapC family toxin [Sphingomonas sp.]